MQDVLARMEEELSRIRETNEAILSDAQPQIQRHLMANLGVNRAMIPQGIGMSQEKEHANQATKALQEQYAQQTTGASLQELQALKDMDEDAQKAWAQALMTANQAAGWNPSPDSAQQYAMQVTNQGNERQRERQAILTRLQQGELARFSLEEAPKAEKMLDEQVEPLGSKCASYTYDSPEARAACDRYRRAAGEYCRRFNGPFHDALSSDRELLLALQDDMTHLEENEARDFREQTGSSTAPLQPGQLRLEAALGHATQAADAYRYRVLGAGE